MTVMTTATTALSSTAKAGLRLARPALIPARVGFNFYAGLLAPLARLLSRDTGTTLTEETPAGPRAVLDADRKDARLHSELHQAPRASSRSSTTTS
jgi:hypothetical protein